LADYFGIDGNHCFILLVIFKMLEKDIRWKQKKFTY